MFNNIDKLQVEFEFGKLVNWLAWFTYNSVCF